MKHGLRSELPVLPGEDPHALQHRLDTWADELQPQTDVERDLIVTAVHASWRLDRCRRAKAAALARQVLQAAPHADDQRDEQVRHASGQLGSAPALSVSKLRQSARGCRWMQERWQALRQELEVTPGWYYPSDSDLALHLLSKELELLFEDPAVYRLGRAQLAALVSPGEDATAFAREYLEADRPAGMPTEEFDAWVRELTAGLPAPECGRAELLAIVAEAMAEVEAYLVAVEAREARERELAVQEAAFETSPEGAARLRYEMAHQRVFRSALQDLRQVQEAREAAGTDAGDLMGVSEEPIALSEPSCRDAAPRGMKVLQVPHGPTWEWRRLSEQPEALIVTPTGIAAPAPAAAPSEPEGAVSLPSQRPEPTEAREEQSGGGMVIPRGEGGAWRRVSALLAVVLLGSLGAREGISASSALPPTADVVPGASRRFRGTTDGGGGARVARGEGAPVSWGAMLRSHHRSVHPDLKSGVRSSLDNNNLSRCAALII